MLGKRSPVLIALALGLSAACGTTVATGQQQGLQGGAGTSLDGSGTTQTPTGTAADPGTPTVGSGTAPIQGSTSSTNRATGATGSSTGTAATVSGSSGSRPVTSASSVPTSGRGWDAKTVYFGVVTQKDFQATASSLGYSGIDPGDTQAQTQAVADDINAHGGVLGRKVVLRFYDVPSLSSAQNPDAAGAAVCADFVQDHPVVAVFNVIHTVDKAAFHQCLAKNHLPLFDGALSTLDTHEAAQLSPYFYSLGTPAWDVLAPVFVQRLKAQGYFGGWNAQLGKPSATSKVVLGVLTPDTPLGHNDEATIVKSLKAAGYGQITTYSYTPPGTEIDGAVLKFAQSGVTHVISDDIELVTFQIHAQSQNYTPRYGINTFNAPGNNLTVVGPPAQQVGDVGVGWGPAMDVSAAQDPGAFNPGVTQCKAIMSKAHITNSDRLAEADGLLLCDSMRFGTSSIISGNGFSGRAVFAGAIRNGLSFSSAFTFSSGLAQGRPYLPASVRDLRWSTSCKCFGYVGTTNYRM